MAQRPDAPPVPRAELLPPTVRALLALVLLGAFGALVSPACGCVANFGWEAAALALVASLGAFMILGVCRRCWRRVVA